jgi:transcription termination/antitermination protein NusG
MRAPTEGGGALPAAADTTFVEMMDRSVAEGRATATAAQWYALWTRSHCERLVLDQLAATGFDVFLPTIDIWSRRAGVRRRISVPMFPSYLFLRRAMDKASYISVLKARGLVRVLGESWDRLDVIPDREIEAIQAVQQAHLPVLPHVFLREGQRVRITEGPLADVEGILVRQKPNSGLLVLSVNLLQQSVAVEVDCTYVVPV